MAKLLQGRTWTVGNQVHPVIQTIPNNEAVFQDNSAPIHTAGTVQSWFDEHEGELPPSSLGSTITKYEHFITALVSFEE
jgi:hypothetical protein